MGRVTQYSREIIEPILERLVEGETLTNICKDEGLPTPGTVNMWALENPTFGLEFFRVRQLQMMAWADEIVTIADDSTGDTVTKVTPQGREYEAVDHENIQRSRLMVETRKFLMARIAPHLFGDRVQHEHSGTLTHKHKLPDRERVRRLAFFMTQGQPVPVIEQPATELLPIENKESEAADQPET